MNSQPISNENYAFNDIHDSCSTLVEPLSLSPRISSSWGAFSSQNSLLMDDPTRQNQPIFGTVRDVNGQIVFSYEEGAPLLLESKPSDYSKNLVMHNEQHSRQNAKADPTFWNLTNQLKAEIVGMIIDSAIHL